MIIKNYQVLCNGQTQSMRQSQEISNQEMANQEMANQEMANQEFVRQEMANQELVRQEMAYRELVHQELARQKIARQGTPYPDIINQIIIKKPTDATFQESNIDAIITKQIAAVREEITREMNAKVELAKSVAIQEAAAKVAAVRNDANREIAAKVLEATNNCKIQLDTIRQQNEQQLQQYELLKQNELQRQNELLKQNELRRQNEQRVQIGNQKKMFINQINEIIRELESLNMKRNDARKNNVELGVEFNNKIEMLERTVKDIMIDIKVLDIKLNQI